MAVKQRPPTSPKRSDKSNVTTTTTASTTSKISTTSGDTKTGTTAPSTSVQTDLMMHATRTTTMTRRGNQSQSDSEYVSTVKTTKPTTPSTTGISIASTISTDNQLPPPIQCALTSVNGPPTNRYGASTSTVTTRQCQPDSRTTVTHTTITYSEPGTTGDTGGSKEPPQQKVPTDRRPDATPTKAPKMVVPNISAPVQSPLFLRVNPIQSAIVAHVSGERLSTPKQTVELWKAETHQTAHYRLAPSAEMRLQCTFVMQSFVAEVALIEHIINAPVVAVTAFCLPTKQKVKKQQISRKIACARLMLAPEGPLQAEKLRPLWETVTFTIAYGKHVAIEYKIPKLSTIKVHVVKCQKQRVVEVDSKKLYKKAAEESVLHWTAEKPHPIILTTVEKSDPQMVKRVRLEQNPLYETMPACCNVAEADIYSTEQVEHNTRSTSGPSKSRTETHRYHEHQLIQKWKNTIHLESRRRRLD